MIDWIPESLGQITSEQIVPWLRAVLVVVVGLVVARLATGLLARTLGERLDAHSTLLARRAVSYAIVALFVVTALHQLGFDLSLLLGAAGVMTIAIGFAAQTSASNLVSGLFLIAERPFSVGDVIRVGETTGEVISIDLMSAKLRTFDNLYVRLPNESLVRSQITNLTRFAIRRIDLQLSVAYKEDIGSVRDVLLQVADLNPLSLEEPPPLVIVTGFGDSSINIQFSVWVDRTRFLELRNAISEEIKQAFEAAGIEIPFPHRSLYAGSQTEAFPVRIVDEAATEREASPSVPPPAK